jgi:NitT/TauT family transport system substrate-binding protein
MRLLAAAPRAARRAGRTRRRTLGVAAVAAGLLVVAGCKMPGGSSAAGPPVSATLTVSAVPGVADAPLFIGIKDGLFSRAGLTIKLQSFATMKSQVQHLKNGTVNVAFGDYANLLFANQARPSPNLAIVADGYDCAPGVMEILTLPGSPVASPQDLAGKRIGTPEPQSMTAVNSRPYSLETTAAWAALANQNVSPASVHWVAMPTPRLATALQTHQVDAILVTEPTISETESQLGLVPVLDACSGPTQNLPLDGYFTTRAYAKQHAAALAAFRSVLARAQATAAISAPVQTALETYAKMDKRTAALVTVGTYPTSLLPQNIQRVANLMFFYNALTSPASAAQLSAP